MVFVSDFLYNDTEYMTLMSVCVVVQTIICLSYTYRHRKEYPVEFWLMWISLIGSIIGWFLLINVYLDASNAITTTHVVGVCMFLFGDVLYFVFVVRDSWLAYLHLRTRILFIRGVAVTILFMGCIATTTLFVNRFLRDRTLGLQDRGSRSDSWVFEHTGYLIFAAAHVIFFMFETPDPFNHKKKRGRGDEPVVVAHDVAAVPITVEDIKMS